MNSLPQRFGFEKVYFLDVGRPSHPGRVPTLDVMAAGCANFLRQPHFDHVPGFASFDEAQSTFLYKTAHRRPHRTVTKASTTGKPRYRKTQPAFPFQPAVPEQMRPDGPVYDIQAQPRYQMVLELYPNAFEVWWFVLHGQILRWNWEQS